MEQEFFRYLIYFLAQIFRRSKSRSGGGRISKLLGGGGGGGIERLKGNVAIGYSRN